MVLYMLCSITMVAVLDNIYFSFRLAYYLMTEISAASNDAETTTSPFSMKISSSKHLALDGRVFPNKINSHHFFFNSMSHILHLPIIFSFHWNQVSQPQCLIHCFLLFYPWQFLFSINIYSNYIYIYILPDITCTDLLYQK